MNALVQANELAKQYVSQLRPLVEEVLIADNGFFLSGLDRYSLGVVADADNESKDEPDFGSVLPLSFFNEHVTCAKDVVVHYLHVMGHKKCDVLWRRTIVPRREFLIGEINFLEEMYNQRLLDRVAPSMCRPFSECFKSYDVFIGFQNQKLRSIINSVLDRELHEELHTYLKFAHGLLYQLDPIMPATFDWYMKNFYGFLTTTDFRQLIKEYDLI